MKKLTVDIPDILANNLANLVSGYEDTITVERLVEMLICMGAISNPALQKITNSAAFRMWVLEHVCLSDFIINDIEKKKQDNT